MSSDFNTPPPSPQVVLLSVWNFSTCWVLGRVARAGVNLPEKRKFVSPSGNGSTISELRSVAEPGHRNDWSIRNSVPDYGFSLSNFICEYDNAVCSSPPECLSSDCTGSTEFESWSMSTVGLCMLSCAIWRQVTQLMHLTFECNLFTVEWINDAATTAKVFFGGRNWQSILYCVYWIQNWELFYIFLKS